MRLNLLGRGAVVALLLATAGASQVAGNFADAAGFSGRAGATCIACHTEAPVPPTPAAQAVLEGLPAAWDPGATYDLRVAVTGGPQAMPAPQPQGGFDLAVGGGSLAVPSGMAALVRLVGTQEATYYPEGTLHREWTVTWTAPGLEAYPAAVPVWLAVLSANGNHVIASNTSDGGERFDAADALQASVPPSPAAMDAWRALPLAAPEATASLTGGRWTLEGRHGDGNATRLLWSLDGGPWQARDTAATWRLELGALAGDHTVRLRSEGLERSSPDVTLALDGPDGLFGGGKDTPLPALLPLAALTLAILARRSRP